MVVIENTRSPPQRSSLLTVPLERQADTAGLGGVHNSRKMYRYGSRKGRKSSLWRIKGGHRDSTAWVLKFRSLACGCTGEKVLLQDNPLPPFLPIPAPALVERPGALGRWKNSKREWLMDCVLEREGPTSCWKE